MEIQRILSLPQLLAKSSIFLFGPRGTGKTSLIREQLQSKAVVIDLLRQSDYGRLAEDPSLLESIILGKIKKGQWVVIDEVQKLPALLDEVHRLIEERKWHFLLTGSSARKLRRGHANLLGGRAWIAELKPMTWMELTKQKRPWDLARALRYGTLPRIYFSTDPLEELDAYVQTYLTLEVQAESLTRNLPRFQRFLKVAALTSGQLINFASVSSDTGIPETTVKEYYEILKDTLIGFQLEPLLESKKRKAIRTAKFYLFDTGVMHTLLETESLDKNSDLYGKSFEQWLINEVLAYRSYNRKKDSPRFWRDKSGYEVDLVMGNKVAIEVKSTRRVSSGDLKGLREFEKEGLVDRLILVSQDPVSRKAGSIEITPLEVFLTRLWDDEYF